ncbi:ribonuclease HI, partial [bacterium LRH843]|nr:ribonuclease HI [bacterium LRH843]
FAYTDGACSGNPGPGGWGVLMRATEGDTIVKERELQGGEANTTNNRMELMAAIAALEALARPSRITVITDSAYVKNGV